jgi:hypothetical protein
MTMNPLRNEADAFRIFLYVLGVLGVIVAVVLILRTVT